MVHVIRDIKNADGEVIATQEEDMTDAQYAAYLAAQQGTPDTNPTLGPPASDPAVTLAPADQAKTLHTAGPGPGPAAEAAAPEPSPTSAPPATKKTKASAPPASE